MNRTRVRWAPGSHRPGAGWRRARPGRPSRRVTQTRGGRKDWGTRTSWTEPRISRRALADASKPCCFRVFVFRVFSDVPYPFASPSARRSLPASHAPPPPASPGGVTVSPPRSRGKDVGYQAGNSMSGSRQQQPEGHRGGGHDLHAGILSDFGATSLADLIGYAPSMQVDMLDAAADTGTSFLASDLRDTRIQVSPPAPPSISSKPASPSTPTTERLELSVAGAPFSSASVRQAGW